MSLDVYLEVDDLQTIAPGKIFVRECGSTREVTREEWDRMNPGVAPITLGETESRCVFRGNITHNLNAMAEVAGVYYACWRPEETGAAFASDLVQPLEAGLTLLMSDPDRFRRFNPENGWGTYEGLVDFVRRYLEACRKWPDARVSTWR